MVGVGLTGMATSTITGEAARMMKGQSGTNEDLLGDAISGFGNAIFAAQVYSALQNYQPKGNSSQSIKDAVAKAIQRLRVLSCSKGAGNPTLANLGNTGRTVANNLNEQLAMKQVMSNPLAGAEKLPITMTDSRWEGADGWVKMQNVVRLSDGTKINIHFVYNEILNLVDDFKFK